MKVGMADLKRDHDAIINQLSWAYNGVVRNSSFILGKEVKGFEKEFADFVGVDPAHCVGVSSGTSALEVSLETAGLTYGDKVITTPFTFIATANAPQRFGIMPLFADIDPINYNIDPEKIEELVGRYEGVKAIIPVHLFGHPSNMDAIQKIANKHNLTVIEDCAQAHGSKIEGQHVGTLGDYGCFSFHPAKLLGALGDAGVVVVKNKEKADELRARINQGRYGAGYDYILNGTNARMDGLQAAFLSAKLKEVPRYLRQRRKHAEFYHSVLAGLGNEGHISLPYEEEGTTHNFAYFTLEVEDRDALRKHLDNKGIFTSIFYPKPLNLVPSMQGSFTSGVGKCLVAERLSERVLSIPVFPSLKEEERQYVADSIIEFYS